MDEATKAFRRNGAVLELSARDAGVLVVRNIGSLDPRWNRNGLLGVHVPGGKIDRFLPGEPSRLRLAGGIDVARDDETGDRIESMRTIDIRGLFDE
jgi:hypothetical protein